jgi:hypothetical protein
MKSRYPAAAGKQKMEIESISDVRWMLDVRCPVRRN